MNAWDYAKSVADKQASGDYVRLKDNGDKIVVAICGDPHVIEQHWTGEKYVECTGKGCGQCTSGNKASGLIKFNVYVPDDDEMKILEGPMKLFSAVVAVRDKYSLENDCFEITRHGKAKDPKTTYSALPNRKIDPAMRARIQACRLHDLGRGGKGDGGAGQSTAAAPQASAKSGVVPGPMAKAGAPAPVDDRISLATANELVARLRVLGRPVIDGFLMRFGVQKIRDLKAADEAAAKAFLDDAERPAPDEGEMDEFAS